MCDAHRTSLLAPYTGVCLAAAVRCGAGRAGPVGAAAGSVPHGARRTRASPEGRKTRSTCLAADIRGPSPPESSERTHHRPARRHHHPPLVYSGTRTRAHWLALARCRRDPPAIGSCCSGLTPFPSRPGTKRPSESLRRACPAGARNCPKCPPSSARTTTPQSHTPHGPRRRLPCRAACLSCLPAPALPCPAPVTKLCDAETTTPPPPAPSLFPRCVPPPPPPPPRRSTATQPRAGRVATPASASPVAVAPRLPRPARADGRPWRRPRIRGRSRRPRRRRGT